MAGPRELASRIQVLLDLAAVAVSGCGAPVDTTVIETGDVAWDNCCNNGIIYAKVDRINPSENFPQLTLVRTGCPSGLAAYVELGILRCTPGVDSQGVAPTPAVRTEVSLDVIRDASALYNVLIAHTPDWSNHPAVIEQWRPLGPQGNCVGGAWFFYLDVCLTTCGT